MLNFSYLPLVERRCLTTGVTGESTAGDTVGETAVAGNADTTTCMSTGVTSADSPYAFSMSFNAPVPSDSREVKGTEIANTPHNRVYSMSGKTIVKIIITTIIIPINSGTLSATISP